MNPAYSDLIGQSVIVRARVGTLRVPLRGRLLSQTSDVLRLRIADSWNIDVAKSQVERIEHAAAILGTDAREGAK